MKNWIKLIAIALLGTGVILGANEYLFAPEASTITTTPTPDAPVPEKKEEPAEDWEKVLEKKRKDKEAEERRKLAAEKLFNNLGLEKPAADAKKPATPGNMFAKPATAGGGGGPKSGGGGGGNSGGGGGGSSGGGGSGGGGSGGGNQTTPPAEPIVEEPEEETTSGDYWLDATGVRHNPNCQYYKNVEGSSSGAESGKPCEICGG